MKLSKKIGLGLVLAFAAIQLVTYERTNPPVVAGIAAAPDLKAILSRACYDCHSNETKWPWYSRVAPASWLVHHDVIEGRAALSFSDWEALSAEKQSKLRREIGKEVAEGEMPPWFYTPLHPRSALSSADKQILQAWSRSAGDAPGRGERDEHDE